MSMRLVAIAGILVASSAASADPDDPRAIMREAAVQQAETVPPLAGPPTQAASNGKARGNGGGDGQATRGPDDHVPPGLSEAHRAAVAAAHSEGALHAANPANGPPGQSTARSANNGNAAADAGQRGAAAAAHEHAVHSNNGKGNGNGNGNGNGMGMGMGVGHGASPPGGGKP
jgi:hypothetical protein